MPSAFRHIMNILFLDDDPTRAQIYMRENADVVWVETAEACIDYLKAQPWELVSLDHDLGHDGAGTAEHNGMRVVEWIEEHKPEVKHFHVHSWNIPASIMMVKALTRAGYSVTSRPFR